MKICFSYVYANCHINIMTSSIWRCLAPLILLYSSIVVADDAQSVLSTGAKNSNESLLWGPYRPNLYFGVRPRIPKSLVTGLLWAKIDDYTGIQQSKGLAMARQILF